MGNGYSLPSRDPIDAIGNDLRQARRRLGEVETQRGSQLFDIVSDLRSVVDNLAATIATLSSSGATWYGPVSTGGSVVADAGMASAGVYSNLLTTAYRVQYVNSAGPMGYVPSSRQFKEDEQPAPDIREAVLALRLLTFRYREEFGGDGERQWGLIAEDVAALGFTWLVDYDENGQPFGIKYERLALALIPLIQDHERRLRSLEGIVP